MDLPTGPIALSSIIFVDTSAFYALQNAGDSAEHSLALEILRPLEAERALLVTTDYVLDETYTLLRVALGHGVAVAFGRALQRGGIEVVQIDVDIQREAWRVFARCGDKDCSFTDCTSFAVMRRGKLKVAFTFDRHFQQFGFTTLPQRLPTRRK